MSGQNKENIIKKGPVCNKESYTIRRENCIEVDLKQLQNFMGDYQNIDFELEIRIKETKCLTCQKDIVTFPIYLNMDGTYCENCKKDNCAEVQEKSLYTCKYKGCMYFGPAENLPKHELWYCTFSVNPCYLCQIRLRNKTMLQHWQQDHVQSVHCANSMFHDNLKTKIQYISELNVFGAVLFCWWVFENSHLKVKVASNMSKVKISDYVCHVKTSLHDRTIEMVENHLCQNYDWSIDFKITRRSYGIGKYSFEFSITKKSDGDVKTPTGSARFYFNR